MLDEPYLSLSELNRTIRTVLDEWLCEEFWVAAEVAEASVRRNQHCYLQLVEKQGGRLVAQARATLWASRRAILEEFERTTRESLKAGMEVLLRVRVRYHEVYGLSLDVSAINPLFTLGDMARRKRETLERLAHEGLLERNGYLPFPAVPQRIAVVSSPSAAGLGDFVTHLRANPFGYRFSTALFEAAVQGEGAEKELVHALKEVGRRARLFDVVAILRGGGSQVDLGCFDGYDLAAAIAACPLPVVTGVGHEKDECVADQAAHTRCKTPTAAAELIVDHIRSYEAAMEAGLASVRSGAGRAVEEGIGRVELMARRLEANVGRAAQARRETVDSLATRFSAGVHAGLARQERSLAGLHMRAGFGAERRIGQQEARARELGSLALWRARLAMERADAALARLARDVETLDPANVLRRGYSITRLDGRAVRDAAAVAPGQAVRTQLHRGRILSRVEATEGASEEDAAG
ncbi:MAG: exodeoxyribonuclease VII large subunit [Chthonomonadales bacterium]|nr:exodeoxyribonuclease VII large subunit [Chthonomonadales bacterium]